MIFNELDKRAIEWNQIANGHRSTEERINTQIDQCNEEMCKEFFYWLGEWNKFNSKHSVKEIKTELLDGFADSRFVFAEFLNLENTIGFYEHTNNYMIELFRNVITSSRDIFGHSTLVEVYSRVIESNFSKFISAELMIEEQAIFEAGLISGRFQCDCVPELNNGYWVFRDQNGKIRKPSTFKPVDLSDLI